MLEKERMNVWTKSTFMFDWLKNQFEEFRINLSVDFLVILINKGLKKDPTILGRRKGRHT